MRFLIRAAAVIGLLAAFAWAEDKQAERKDAIDAATFVKKAASGNMAEIAAGDLAYKQAVDSEARAFAAKLSKDHTNAQKDLQEAARSAGIEMPRTMLSDDKKAGERLAEHKGKKDFDAAFVKEMVDAHTRAVDLYEKAGKSVKEVALSRYIEKTLPILRDHLKTAQALARMEGKDRAAKKEK